MPIPLYTLNIYKSLVSEMVKKARRICEWCGKDFISEAKRFCSRKCYYDARKNEQIKLICTQCGKIFYRKKSGLKTKRGNFCSRNCYTKWQSENIKKERHPRWCGGEIKRICKHCGNIFFTKPSVVKNGGGLFCSRTCKNIFQSENEIKREQLRKIRKNIMKPTKPERIFREICQRNNLPFRYVGDGQLWIGKDKKLNPDFVECNGKKIVIEIFGDYWHSPLLNRNLREGATLKYRKNHYKRYKWHPIFLWDTDLKRKDAESFVLNMLREVLI